MSHVAAVQCEVRDLEVLKSAAEAVGLEFREGQRTYKWFGKWVNDWHGPRAAVTKGYDPTTFGTCDHVLAVKGSTVGSQYEIGVTANDDGTYGLVYDTWGGGGQTLERLAGTDLVGLRNEVAAETASRFARRHGSRVQRTTEGQTIRMVLKQ